MTFTQASILYFRIPTNTTKDHFNHNLNPKPEHVAALHDPSRWPCNTHGGDATWQAGRLSHNGLVVLRQRC